MHRRAEFPALVSYNRFVELTPSLMVPLLAYLQQHPGVDRTGAGSQKDALRGVELVEVAVSQNGLLLLVGWVVNFITNAANCKTGILEGLAVNRRCVPQREMFLSYPKAQIGDRVVVKA